MAEEEIVLLLEEKEEMTITELADEIGISIVAVWKNLRGMLRADEVEVRIKTREEIESEGKKFTGRHFAWRLKNEQ